MVEKLEHENRLLRCRQQSAAEINAVVGNGYPDDVWEAASILANKCPSLN